MFWTPEADPGTVMLTAIPAILGLEGVAPPDLDPRNAQFGPEGLSIVHGKGAAAIRLLVLGDARPDQPLAALVPLDADGLDRIDAVTRLWRGLHGRPVFPDTRLTAHQRRRLRHMLQAVDGSMNGASYREIANVIYGAPRVAADSWKTSALRDSTIDLVKDGLAMIAGGYRKLLRHRRKS
ncbi:DUF2285 domain-containing protein [Mesorhizobium sp. M0510]|uniref:DUF2285 domain-containing protein n=1 Tax=Mesorhizobium sp. M0510 TaxID=2956954 RepID=UPI00333803B6